MVMRNWTEQDVIEKLDEGCLSTWYAVHEQFSNIESFQETPTGARMSFSRSRLR